MDFMTTYKRLALPVRHKGLSVMEVLEVLRTGADFCDDDQAEFHVGRLQLLSGDRVGLPDIRFRSANENAVYCVCVPASTHFEAIPKGVQFSRRFEITRLHGAKIDGRGNITFRDGSKLTVLKFELAQLPAEPSSLDWRIVHLTLEQIGAERCYRSLQEGCPADDRDRIPDLRFLDLTKVSGLKLPPLRDIVWYIASKYKKVSGQQVANSLQKFGIRHPQKRSG